MPLNSPLPVDRRSYALADGSLSAVHFCADAGPIEMVFLHATGFNALTYRSLLEPLGVHSVAIDMRGHGMSELPADPETLENWNAIAADIAAFLDQYTDAPVVLAGHSCGAVVSCLTAVLRPKKVKALVSFDPVVLPFWTRSSLKFKFMREGMKRNMSMARNAGRRREDFDSFEAAIKRYEGRGAFKGLPDAVLRDYVWGGFKETDTGVRLACAPLWEQAMFVAQGHNIFKGLRRGAPASTKIVLAGKYAPHTILSRYLIRRILKKGQVEHYKERYHFFPLLEPDFTRTYLKAALDA